MCLHVCVCARVFAMCMCVRVCLLCVCVCVHVCVCVCCMYICVCKCMNDGHKREQSVKCSAHSAALKRNYHREITVIIRTEK